MYMIFDIFIKLFRTGMVMLLLFIDNHFHIDNHFRIGSKVIAYILCWIVKWSFLYFCFGYSNNFDIGLPDSNLLL